MNKRVKELRKTLKMSQDEFGKTVGVTGAAISKIESGDRNVTDQLVFALCAAFHCDETWLRTGEGEMFRTRSRDEELAAFMGSITLRDDPDDEFKRRLLHVLSRMTTDEWRLLEELAARLVEETKKDRPE